MVQEKIVTSSGQTDYLTFLYNSEGLTGFVRNGTLYTYRKNLFGDIIAIYQGNTKVAEYAYDAYGNCRVITGSNIGTLNPLRYRGYYYDSDLGLYYLQSRYYDPETGRFINADDVSYLDPESIHGLNLYAYCLNNPVMYVDPSGHSIIALVAILLGAAIGATIGAIKAVNENKSGWDLIKYVAIGFFTGAALGGLLVAGGAALVGGVKVAMAIPNAVASVKAIVATGLLAFNTFAIVIAPFLGMDVTPIEIGGPSDINLPNNRKP